MRRANYMMKKKTQKKWNTPTGKHPGGRPPIWSSPEDLQEQIDKYYAWAKKNKKPLTIERLAVFLEIDRHTVLKYGEKDKFYSTVKKARDMILASKADMLNSLGGVKTGIIFDLKNNHGFVDKQELQHSGSITVERVMFNGR